MIRAAIYARVSTTKDEQATSPENQIAACRDRCEREQWHITAVEQDKRTGRNMDRAGWRRVLDLVRSRSIDVLVVTHRDRISRNRRDFEDVRAELFEPFGVRIVPLLGIEVDPEIIQTRWLEEDEFTQAQRFSELLSWKTRLGTQRRNELGYWTTTAPYGTRVNPDERGVPVCDPEQWPVLVAMFERAADGASYGEIRRWLTATGIPAKRGGSWALSSVWDILQNPFYIGELWRGGQVYQLRHQCRIDRETWEAAHGEGKARRRAGRPCSPEYVYLLPRVVCTSYRITSPQSRAGEPLPLYRRYSIGRGGVHYYHYYRADRLRATGGVEAEPAGAAPLRGPGSLHSAISAPELDHAVLTELARIADNHELLQVQMRDARAVRLHDCQHELARVKRRSSTAARELAKRDRSILELVEHGGFPASLLAVENRAAELRDRLARFADERQTLERELVTLTDTEPDIVRAGQRINAVRALWEREAWTELQELLALLVDSVDLNLDRPVLKLRPVMSIIRLAPRHGVFTYPLDLPRRLLAA